MAFVFPGAIALSTRWPSSGEVRACSRLAVSQPGQKQNWVACVAAGMAVHSWYAPCAAILVAQPISLPLPRCRPRRPACRSKRPATARCGRWAGCWSPWACCRRRPALPRNSSELLLGAGQHGSTVVGVMSCLPAGRAAAAQSGRATTDGRPARQPRTTQDIALTRICMHGNLCTAWLC